MNSALLNPDRLWTRREVLERPGPVPPAPGVYAWYFTGVPPEVPIEYCHVANGEVLLYVGISPKRPSADGTFSRQTLRTRVRYHYRGNAYGSTLRLTLGSLLADQLGISLRRVGTRGRRLTFSSGEAALSEWMDQHARVCWLVDAEPWLTETRILKDVNLPLNLDQNTRSGFHAQLSKARARQREQARISPVLPR
ncbi:hypothetical protein FJ693_10030 [Georgenia yuyongxinii]|uniref:GIY-YIG catalytic domain-containing protein n=2 Tax=Georgenia yuyongxinii TaxID=2589797 RepID=A0A552WRD0_9MICO|nr:hypothetical protein FJ693_10030 [Georgenia yuyongxinii]